MSLTHIHWNTAQQAHNELLNALGSENNPSQWIVFMRTARKHLPFLFESGRPTKQQIESSAIGQLGFTSWADMVESDQDKFGLSWSINSWKQWSKAFKVVNQYEYLCDMNITASAVMKLASDFRDVEFPRSKEELEQVRSAIAKKRKADEAEKVSNLKTRVSELEKELVAANAKADALSQTASRLDSLIDEVSQLRTDNVALKMKSEDVQMKNNELEHESRVNKIRYEDLKNRLSSMTFWQRIRGDFEV